MMLVVGGALVLSRGAVVEVDRVSEDETRAMARGDTAHAAGETSEMLAVKIAGTLCLVCEEPLSVGDITLTVRGRHIHLHPGRYLEAWGAAKEQFFATLAPRGMLTREGEAASVAPADGWFWLALYAVAGLLIGTLGTLVAVGRKGGWSKRPSIPSLVRCPECAANVPPAARLCTDCGTHLVPVSETATECR
jgi:hypothetical protein